MDSALQCLVLVARQHGVELGVERLKREHAVSEPEVTETALTTMARQAGLHAETRKPGWAGLQGLRSAFPLITRLKNGFSVVLVGIREGVDGEVVQILDPLAAQIELTQVPRARFEEVWTGSVLLLRAADRQGDGRARFGWSWFFDEVRAQRGLFTQVILIALALQFLAFAPAIFSQVVYDKVIGYHSDDTLHVLFSGVILALLFNAVLGGLRSQLLLHATSRIDIRSAGFSMKRLLELPLSLFQNASAGVLVKHLQQLSMVREFFTGNLLLTLIELLALVIVLPVLFFFSWELTLIVLVFSLLIALNSFIGMRRNKRNLLRLYELEGQRQSVLMETIHGMETVKAMALEPMQSRAWLDLSAKAVRAQFDIGRLNTFSGEISGFLMKLLTVVLTWAGVLLIFEHKITLGALIAFSMLAQRVTGPLVQVVQLITKYQQTAIAVQMLGSLLNRPAERERTAGISPDLRGQIEFEDVSFSYQPQQPVLQHINLRLQPGQKIGVVGRSGSGKSTLMRLLLGLVWPTQGVIRLDGYDIREFDLSHLRAQIGVVSQRNFLFKGSVRDNIAKARPGASLEEVIAAARLARADEFIERLPQGYETALEEDGANLSGGQKQRLALARALLMQPRILILDEATSALDPESEAVIRENLPRMAQGRTVINISHRLSSLVAMDVILVIDQGRVIDAAPHEVLLKRCELYRRLWVTQNGHLLRGGAV